MSYTHILYDMNFCRCIDIATPHINLHTKIKVGQFSGVLIWQDQRFKFGDH